jgi:cytochrome c oxidase subunit 1
MATHAPVEPHAAPGGHDHHAPPKPLSYWWKRAAWWTAGSLAFSFVFVVFLRAIFDFSPLWDPQVYATVASIFSVLGFLIGIGNFDYWWQWARGKPVGEDHSMHGARSWKDYLRVNTDHKVIGIQYLVTVFVFFVIGGLLAEAVRAELAQPGQQLVSGETYNGLFSVHATLMIFLFVIPAFAGLANFVLPIMIGAKDMAFPRLNALSIWMLPPAGLLMAASVIVGPFTAGWTAYTPLASQGEIGSTLFEVGVQFAGASSIMTAVNFLVTIITMRAPGMTVWRMPLLVWANATTSALVVLGTPFIAGSQFMTLFDRVIGMNFFNSPQGGDVIMYQHVFWFYSHPAVYIMMLPGFGIVSEVLATFARKPVFGYRALAFSTVAIAVLGFSVWAHHMFVSGMAPWLRVPMMVTTVIIAVPTGVKIFSWLGTIWRGKIHLKTPMLFVLGFLFTFVIGGLSGVFLGSVPVDIQVSDSYFIVAHIHYVLYGGSVFTIFAGVYYWFPKMTGRMYNERLGQWHFWLTFIGFNATFLPMHWLGLHGMPRRVADYDDRFGTWNAVISAASVILAGATLVFFYNIIKSWRSGPRAPWNPWRGRTMEWLVSSPPSIFNFEATPQVVGGPYQYGIPGARHAVIFAPEEIGGELREDLKRTIVVVANRTLPARSLLERIQEKSAEGFWRFSIVVPLEGAERRASERRLQVALAVLAEAGVEADGQVVDGGPVEALAAAISGEAEVYEVIVGSYPATRSEWMRHDAVDRLRKATKLPVTHVVVTPEEALEPVSAPGVEHVLVVANEPVGGTSLADAIRARADRGPARFTIVVPLALPRPTWSDEAIAIREAAIGRVRAAVDQLLESGVQIQGEVVDGDAVEAVRGALVPHRPKEILLGTYPGEPGAPDEEAIREAARGVPVEHLVLEEEAPAAPSGGGA